MPHYLLERRIPSCLVSKALLSAIETYLKIQMRQKLGEAVGTESDYRLSITEKFGTETLASVEEHTPDKFSDGTNSIQIRWQNEHKAPCQLEISIGFHSDYYLSRLKVDSTGSAARETANGIGDAILRLLEPHRTYNWVFNPFEYPVASAISVFLANGLLGVGSVSMFFDREIGLYLLSGCVFFYWIYLSASYLRPFVCFDTRQQQLLAGLWKWVSLGTLGFFVFGTLAPLLRRVLIGF